MKRLIALTIMLLPAAAAAQATAPTTRPFVVYDNLFSFTGKPDTAAMGWRQGLTSGALLTADKSEPDETLCRQFGRDAAALGAGTLAVIDIEHWPTDLRKHTAAQVAESVAKLRQATAWVREGAGSTPILVSHYALPVLRDYWTPVTGKPEELARWRQANDQLAELAADCDVICPSLYAFYWDEAGWVKYAKANIAEAKRFGKPVIPFVWPRMHESNLRSPPGQFLPPGYWTLMLRTVRDEGCDGVIIWDWAGFNDRIEPGTGRRTSVRGFDPTWPWWRATVEEMANEREARDLSPSAMQGANAEEQER